MLTTRSQKGNVAHAGWKNAGRIAQHAAGDPELSGPHFYLGRISGPLLDRIDLHIEVPPVKFREITSERTGETSAQIRERVIAARQRQQARFAGKPKISCNARMGSRELKSYCALDETAMELLKFAMADLNLSARAFDRVLKVSRTIADLAGAEAIASEHVSEAIQYRSLDRQL